MGSTLGRRGSRNLSRSLAPTVAIAVLMGLATPALADDPPANDDIGGATAITGLTFIETASSLQATTAPDDPDCYGNAATVWYSYTTPTAATLDAYISYPTDYVTTLSAYTGSPGSLTQINCSNGYEVPYNEMFIDVDAGETIYFMIGSYDGTGGIYTFEVEGLPPENRRIAFHSNRDGDFDIYTAESDGSDVVKLTENPGYDVDPSWSPDGTKIAYTSDANRLETVWVMDADGSNKTALNTGFCSRPTWSPDGTKIACGDDGDIFVMDAVPGAPLVNITNSAATGTGNPSWSPDGTTIAFDRSDGNDSEIYSVSATGGIPVNLTDNDGNDYNPDWSPNGTQIAYVGWDDYGEYGIVVASADMSVRALIAVGDVGFPRWSPGGTRILFVGVGASGETDDYDLFTVRARGGAGLNITSDSAARDSGPSWNSAPLFQPDATIRLGSGAEVGQDVYNGSAAGQVVAAKTKPGTSKTFTISVGNDGSWSDSLTLQGSGGSRGFKVAYLEGTLDITAAVVAGTYTISNLAPGASTTVLVKVTASMWATAGATKGVKVTASSLGQPGLVDAVGAKVTVSWW